MVYADGGELALNAGVIPYDLNTPLFSDYAHKLRTIWMPPGKAAVLRAELSRNKIADTVVRIDEEVAAPFRDQPLRKD